MLNENTAIRSEDELEIMGDVNYVRKSSSLVSEALNKGCDVIQMANGDIYITETKTVTFHYTYDKKKGKMIRVNNGGRMKRVKKDDFLNNADELVDDLEGEMA
ncbi:MAG: DUF2671 domain-containing protein [Sphingobacteriia bacterium]|nr:DUF2671 domain-containing protein [Sphingobacteriia bacterium]